jgi:MFS transporter, DHA1 family, inner membrane transport protein
MPRNSSGATSEPLQGEWWDDIRRTRRITVPVRDDVERSSLPPRVLVLALGTFAVGTDAFVVAGLLGEIAGDLHVSVARAGQTITVFSLAYALLAPVLASAVAGSAKKDVLLGALAVFTLGNVMTATAMNDDVLMASRVIAAAGAALVTPTSSVTAAELVGESRRAKAISVAVSGLTISTAIGAPLGTALGALGGWRMTMGAVAALGALAAIGLAVVLPRTPATTGVTLRDRLASLADVPTLLVLCTTLVGFVAIYIVYSYATALFGAGGPALAIILLAFGVAAVVGNLLAGHLADRIGPERVVHAALLLLGVSVAVLGVTRTSAPAAIATMAVVGFASFSITSPQQHRLIRCRPADPTVTVSLNASFIYLSVALAGGLGGILLSAVGVDALVPTAAVFAFAGLAISLIAQRIGRGTR